MEADFYWYERQHAAQGEQIAGADEAGRGPLAGPVVAAAVILPTEHPIEGVADSKKLSEKKRGLLYERITQEALAWGVGMASVEEIERLNILNAARLAFQRAVAGLSIRPAKVYADQITNLELNVPWEAIVKGDAKVYSIAAASIVAKETRDRLMRAYAEEFPGYGFERHKGYGTKAHFAALQALGLCPIHRRSFLRSMEK